MIPKVKEFLEKENTEDYIIRNLLCSHSWNKPKVFYFWHDLQKFWLRR